MRSAIPSSIAARACLILLTLQIAAAAGDSPEIVNVRTGMAGELTRFVLDLDGPAAFATFTLADPPRVVIDLDGVSWALDERERPGAGLITRIRFGRPDAALSRVVLDLGAPAAIRDTFILEPEGDFGHRIVVDIAPLESAALPAASVPDDGSPRPGLKPRPPVPVIVLDPGHGGPDPGAVGRSGAYEKTIVLEAARELKALLEATGGYHVVLTRDGDWILRLADRVLFARMAQADLFISIHADSIADPAVRGTGVYTLSETASDEEAAMLAQSENRADLIEGVDFVSLDYDSVITNILIDLAQREAKNASSAFAGILAEELAGVVRLRRNVHRFAGFRVLKAPDVPSVLIEMGFMSNRTEERLMQDRAWRRTFLGAVVKAVDGFFAGRGT